MYGSDIGTLNIYQVPTGMTNTRPSPQWSRSYDMGNGWRKGQTTLDLIGSYQVVTDVCKKVKVCDIKKICTPPKVLHKLQVHRIAHRITNITLALFCHTR